MVYKIYIKREQNVILLMHECNSRMRNLTITKESSYLAESEQVPRRITTAKV